MQSEHFDKSQIIQEGLIMIFRKELIDSIDVFAVKIERSSISISVSCSDLELNRVVRQLKQVAIKVANRVLLCIQYTIIKKFCTQQLSFFIDMKYIPHCDTKIIRFHSYSDWLNIVSMRMLNHFNHLYKKACYYIINLITGNNRNNNRKKGSMFNHFNNLYKF